MFHSSYTESNCWCCRDCDKHQINQKHGYIIPCNERKTCKKFLQRVEDAKTANRLYAEESRNIGDALTSLKRAKRGKY